MQKIIASLALLLLVSCADDPVPVVKYAPDTSGKINLDVLAVNVLDRSNPLGGDTPYTTNNFQPTITNAVRQWATDHLIAVGTTGEATIVIRDVTLRSVPIPHPDSMFTREQTSKYTGHVAIALSVAGREGHGEVSAETSQFQTLPDTPTAVERQNAYTILLNNLMRDLDTNLRNGIKDHLGNFVITAPVTVR